MRERSTWNRDKVMEKAAALSKKADPYTMNQDHPQPSHEEYLTGDPSTFAEDPHAPNTWEAEYDAEGTERDEIGMPEMRGDTFNHAEKTASEMDHFLKKADLCLAVAKLMLGGTKVAAEALEDQAVELMHLPDSVLLSTHDRLAADAEEEDEDEGQEKQAQQQQEEDKADDSDDSDDSDDEGQEKQAQQQQEEEEDEDEGQEKQAQQQQQQQEEDKADDSDDEGQEKQASKTAADMPQMAQQMQQMMATLGQMQQQMAQWQQQDQMMGQQDQMMGQQDMDQQMAQDQMMDDESTLDQMLASNACGGPMAEADIQMDPAPMDVGMDDLGDEDAVLRQLFAQDDEKSEDEDEGQEKQANVRTASSRTVGTRPSGGVAKLGGNASAPAGSMDNNLSNLWKSAPDIREHFGLGK